MMWRKPCAGQESSLHLHPRDPVAVPPQRHCQQLHSCGKSIFTHHSNRHWNTVLKMHALAQGLEAK